MAIEAPLCFEYLYRDASNYKIFGSVVLRGRCGQDLEGVLRARFQDGVYFIPEQIKIPPLQNKIEKYNENFPTEDDHVWHEFSGLRVLSVEGVSEDEYSVEVDDLIAALDLVEKWEESSSALYESLYCRAFC
ncbi:MAG: hypothetical protein AB7G25_04715 [Sphingomonadaceae bacterium]